MRKLVLEIVADPRQAQRGFQSASRSAVVFQRDLGKATRGALAGSGAFKSLGRSIAFASGTFLGVAAAGDFLRSSIDAARDAATVQRQMAAQFKASGLQLGDYQAQIEKTTNRLSLLAGIENDELKAGFTTILRTTGDVNRSLRDLGTAADLARAKHLGLSQAALILAKTEAGNTTLLRRQGFQIAKNATAEEALAKLRQVVAGQARAGTTAQERFGAVLHNTEEIIGTALLPTLNKYLTSGAKWLTQMNESGKLQRDVENATKALGEALAGARDVVVPLAHGFKSLGDAVGGTRNEIKLLAETLIGLKLAKFATDLRGIGAAAGEAGAAGQIGLLTSRLKTLGTIGAIVVTINIVPKIVNSKFSKAIGGDFSGKDLARAIFGGVGGGADPNDFVFTSHGFVRRRPNLLTPANLGKLPFIQGIGRRGLAPLPRVVGGTASAAGVATLTAAQRRLIDLAGNPSLQALKAEQAFDKASLAALNKRFAAHRISAKAFTDATVKLKNDLASTEDQIASLVTNTARDALKAARLNLPARVSGSAQTGIRGLLLPHHVGGLAQVFADSFTAPLRLQLEEARISALGGDLKPVLLKLKAAAQKALRGDKLTIQGRIDAWNEIGRINDQLGGQIKHLTGKFKHVDPNKLLAGFGLSADQRRALAPAIAQIGLGGRVPAGRPHAFAGGGRGFEIVVQSPIYLDGREIASTVTKHQRKDATRRSGSRRGPYAGRH